MMDELWLTRFNSEISREHKELFQWAYSRITELESKNLNNSWKSPYRSAISLLESAERSFQGSYG